MYSYPKKVLQDFIVIRKYVEGRPESACRRGCQYDLQRGVALTQDRRHWP